MFEIGSSLREARERRGFQIGDVERDTRIRSRYLRALEEERFDLIPGWVYAKGFLRTYADYLGLDADQFVDELTSRLPPDEEELPPPPAHPVRRRRITASGALVTFGAVAIVTAGLIWVLGAATGSKHRTTRQAPPPPPARTQPAPPPPRPKPVARTATLVLQASGGRCWVEAHAGSQSGTQLYFATLEQGQSVRLSKKRLWLRLGAPSAVVATLNGKPVALPPSSSPVDLVVTPAGVRQTA